MTEQKNALVQLFTECWKDPALKDRFVADPKSVLKERGVHVPDDLDVKVVNNEHDCIHITMPAAPEGCLLYTSPSPRDGLLSRMPSSA